MNRFPGDKRDWTAQYAAIGEFVTEFEWICSQLRLHACVLLQTHGLTSWSLAEIIFNQRAFAAEALFTCYSQMVAECLGRDHALLQDLSSIRTDFQDLCKLRNDLLHASYLIGRDVVEITDKDTPSEIHVEKRTPHKHGARVTQVVASLDEFKQHIETAKTVKERVKAFVPKVVIALHKSE